VFEAGDVSSLALSNNSQKSHGMLLNAVVSSFLSVEDLCQRHLEHSGTFCFQNSTASK